MMELIEDVFIRCGRCGKVTGIHKEDFDFEFYVYDRGDNRMGEEIEFCHDGCIECDQCGKEISFRISGYEYPVGAFNYEDSEIAGGRFEEEPHMGVIYTDGISQRLPDAVPFARAEIGGQNRLRRLPDTIGAALHEGADVDDHAVNGKGVCPQIRHDLPVEQNGQNPHGNIDEEGGEPGYGNFPEFAEQIGGPHQPQGVFLHEEVGQHDDNRNHGTDGCGKPCTERPHIAGENKDVIAKYVKDAARQHGGGGQGGVLSLRR